MTTPTENELRYVYVAAQGDFPSREDFHDEIFYTAREAGTYCYYANDVEVRVGNRKLFKEVPRWNVWQVPVTIHWEDLDRMH